MSSQKTNTDTKRPEMPIPIDPTMLSREFDRYMAALIRKRGHSADAYRITLLDAFMAGVNAYHILSESTR